MTTILIKKKDTAGAPAAGDLTNAAGGTEIADNTATKRIYTKDSGGNVVELGTNATSSTITDLTVTGNTTLGDADTDTITQAASYVTGTQLKSAKTATNTLNLAAYDVDGTAYTNLVTLTASNTPTLALTSTGVGTINNMSVGAPTASTGAFTTLSASGNVTLGDATTDTVTVNGYMGVGGAGNSTAGLFVTSTALAGANQYGAYSNPTGTRVQGNLINNELRYEGLTTTIHRHGDKCSG